MGTRSDIIVHRADGKWHRIYCHWDGYLSHNGRILFDNYTDQKQVDALVALGDLSSLGPEIGKKHDFERATKLYEQFRAKKITEAEYDKRCAQAAKECTAYGRDRGEKDVEGTIGDSLAEVWPEQDTWTEFTYVWDDGKWRCGDPDQGTQTLLDLGDLLMGKKTLAPIVKAFGATIGRHHAHDPAKPDEHNWSWSK